MIKKIFLIVLCIAMLGACGRKNNPKYEAKIDFVESRIYELH